MRIRNIKLLGGIFIVALFVGTCDNQGVQPVQDREIDSPSPAMGKAHTNENLNAGQIAVAREGLLNNASYLLKPGHKLAISQAEYLTTGENGTMGQVIFFNNRGNKQLAGDFVPNNPFLNLDGSNDVTYYVDNTRPTGDLGIAVSSAAIDRAMDTWDGVRCSDLGMTKIPSNGIDTGFIAALVDDILGITFFGGSFNYVSDVTHAGWMPGVFFDIIGGPGGSSSILGATFTIIWVDENGDPIDSDGNGKIDVAWREIYYNDNFDWNDGSTYDVETVALHEAGHGLSQAHFGKAFGTFANGKVHFAPRAVMNAAYSGVQTKIAKTDNAGHCSNWAQWPNN